MKEYCAVIDSTLGLRCSSFGYQYSEIVRSLMSIYFCGGSIITEAVDAEANIIFGAVINEELEDEIRVTVIATGFERRNPAVGARGASRPSYNNSYAQQHSSEKQQAAAPAQPGQAPSYGSGVIKPPTSDTEIPPWIRG